MKKNLNCEQVCALLPFFMENKLSEKLSECVIYHLENCQECMEKYETLKQILNKRLDNINEETEENDNLNRQYEIFKNNLSAYIDNELDDNDNIKIKKIAISNPKARQELENSYAFKRHMLYSFEKTKNELKNDYSKEIIHKIEKNTDNYMNKEFIKLAIIYGIMFTVITISAIRLLYF